MTRVMKRTGTTKQTKQTKTKKTKRAKKPNISDARTCDWTVKSRLRAGHAALGKKGGLRS